MNNYIIIKQVVLGPQHVPTGKTHHYDGEKELPHAVILKIVKYDDVEGFYLLHFDTAGKEITDTFHESVEDALAQAEWEFQVKPSEWGANEK
jgi:hypothetical protein